MPASIVKQKRFFEAHLKDSDTVTHDYIEIPEGRLHYASVGDPTLPAVVFIHGTPGDWSGFAYNLASAELQQQAHLVSVDRLGWGDSTLNDKRVETDFGVHAAALGQLAERLNRQNQGRGVVLVGHSLGASLAPRVAMDFPQHISGLILVAGSLDPELGKPRWFNRVAAAGIAKWVIPRMFNNANSEVWALQGELQAMVPGWAALTLPVTVVQGLKDELVYPANADFAEQAATSAPLQVQRLPRIGHLIPFEHPELIDQAVLDMLQRIAPAP